MTSVSIVLPTYNHYQLTHQALFDIYRWSNSVNEVVIVNDASTDEEVASGLDWWKGSGMLPIREIRAKENKGFLRSSNLGLKRATGDVKILMSNDVRLYGDIVQPILVQLNNNPKSLVGATLYMHDTGWNTFDGKTFPYIEGYLLAMTSDGWEDVGYFDDDFAPFDFEDIELSTKAQAKGYELSMPIKPGMAVHLGAQTINYSPEREAQTRINQEKFRLKWMK